MKISPSASNARRERGGFAVIAMMALLAIMMICLAVNNVTLRSLDRELTQFDKRQAQRWQHATIHAAVAANLTATPDAPRVAREQQPHD